MRRPFDFVAMIAWMLAVGCADPSCKIETFPYAATVDAVSEGGPTIGQKIARFDVTQSFISHTPYGCTDGPLQDVGTIDLTITSTYTVPISFTYDLQGLNAGNPVWSSERTILRIEPGQSLVVGRIMTSPTRLDQGVRVLVKSVTLLS